MSKYGVGLRNVGSYISSGVPWISRQSLNKGQEVKISFPSVTKNVTIRIPSAPNNARNTVMPNGSAAIFFSPSLHAKGNGKVFDGAGFGGTGKDFAVSWWFKTLDPSSGDLVTYFQSGSDDNNLQANYFQLSFDSSGILVDGAGNAGLNNFTNTAHNPKDGNWHHMLATQYDGNFYLYINGNAGSVSSAGNITNVNTFRLGWNGAGGNDSMVWDEVTAFSTGFAQADVTQIYNSGEFFNPRYHAQSSNLVAWWTMGDAGADLAVPINGLDNPLSDYDYNVVVNRFDSVATGAPRNLTAVFNAVAGDWIKGSQGPFASQTIGKLRAHMLSTGSVNGARVISRNHYQELQGYDTQIVLPIKTKELYLTAVDTQVTFEVVAELTGIPSGSMYTLTGSGIDD